jgi:hypothetical protein
MNQLRLILLILFFIGLPLLGCDVKEDIYAKPRKSDGWMGDPNFFSVTVDAYNYTNNQIVGIYILQPQKNDINGAGSTSGQQVTPNGEEKWRGTGISGSVAWSNVWKPPYKFKIWWEHVFDKNLDKKSGSYPKGGGMFDPYDPYTTKQTRPGTAWCEYEIEIKETYNEPYGDPFPGRFRDNLNLYFYPDGTVRGHLVFSGEYSDDKNPPREDIKRRGELPVLQGKPCIKEVPNPYYGKPKPITIN